ncbi:DUF2634 domain-containing protein [Peptostreptococcus equinus]|uniref:DUF2634 domain-containing protein n=1 Tax=Peptostreptococcus equinus TaxID=3003601 RepID=A0ABY7JN26_9FIRM|nr:DUF2634 domain-containing protein [Peptostreptococcus sp. CBA3647]WAW14742.1 DUF2634 domain-containing protein [Peptostreptococcus sp. CBA3647]
MSVNEFPFAGIEQDYITNVDTTLPVPYEIGINFEDGTILKDSDGNVVIQHGLEAIKIWCYLSMMTQRFKHQIFSENYGSEHNELIGVTYTKELTEAESYRYIRECWMVNPYIHDVKDRGVEKVGDKLHITAEIITDYGTATLEGVI